MEDIHKITMSRETNEWQVRMTITQEVCFIFFSGLCTLADATTTALGISTNLAFETNPMVAWRVVNPALFITFEVGWFFITVAVFQFFNHMRRGYNIRRPFLWIGYIMIVATCCVRLFYGFHNVNIITSALREVK